MSRNVYRVTLIDRHPVNGKPLFVLFECQAASVAMLGEDLNAGIVVGSRLYTRKTGERGVYEVYDRRPYAIGKGIVAAIEVPESRLVEYEDAAG